MKQSCLTCRYEIAGLCHRFPPQSYDISMNFSGKTESTVKATTPDGSRYPKVYGTDWCGEWKAAKGE